MVKIAGKYLGDLRCENIHEQSGSVLLTDAPLDNQGKGETFSPTDLFVTSLATCVVTIMGIMAQSRKVSLEGLRYEAEKIMTDKPPRKIAKIILQIWMPEGLTEKEGAFLVRAAGHCPVKLSLAGDVEVETFFNWHDAS